MLYLKLHRDEPETTPPPPLPFDSLSQTWRNATEQTDTDLGEQPMDSIQRVEEALGRVESTFESLSEQVDEICEPIKMADWLTSEDDGPWAA